jgi:hypothetical protein
MLTDSDGPVTEIPRRRRFALWAEVDRWADWLRENDIELIGPVDHKGSSTASTSMIQNGIRLGVTVPMDPEWNGIPIRARLISPTGGEP